MVSGADERDDQATGITILTDLTAFALSILSNAQPLVSSSMLF